VTRTVILTVVAVVWTFLLTGSNWGSDDLPLPAEQLLVPLLLGALPAANLVVAVRDARVLQARSGFTGQIGHQLVMAVAVLINMFLLAIAFFFGAMLINGPIVA